MDITTGRKRGRPRKYTDTNTAKEGHRATDRERYKLFHPPQTSNQSIKELGAGPSRNQRKPVINPIENNNASDVDQDNPLPCPIRRSASPVFSRRQTRSQSAQLMSRGASHESIISNKQSPLDLLVSRLTNDLASIET